MCVHVHVSACVCMCVHVCVHVCVLCICVCVNTESYSAILINYSYRTPPSRIPVSATVGCRHSNRYTLLAQLTKCVALLGLQYVYQMCTTISPVFSSELREDIRHLTQTQSFIVITIPGGCTRKHAGRTGTNNNLY